MGDMLVSGRNSMGCLTNTVLHSCMVNKFGATDGLLSVLEQFVREKELPVEDITRVELHQCPQGYGLVEYTIFVFQHVGTVGGVMYERGFQTAIRGAKHKDFLLYDRKRDGKVEFLHLKH